jgi:hypothetical protein
MSSPSFLDEVRQMPYPNKLTYVADDDGAASFAYERLEIHQVAAATQVQRIQEALCAQAKQPLPEPRLAPSSLGMATLLALHRRSYAQAFAEMHFYFVCWTCIRHMLDVITAPPLFREARKALSRHRKYFDQYDGGRNSFEHFEQRLPGGKSEGRVREVVQGVGASPSKILYGYHDGKYTHSNQEWDVTRVSLTLLTTAIDETLTVVHRLVDEEVARRFPTT